MYTYICKNCGKEFQNPNKNRIYCSNECRKSVLKHNLSQNKKDLTGKKFGRLTAIKSRNVKGRYEWFCKCDCGNQVWVRGAYLTNGHTQSCGCIHKDDLKNNNKKRFEKYRKRNYVEGTSIAKIKSKIPSNNQSGIKGVYWHTQTQKWVAKLIYQGHAYQKEFKEKDKAIKYKKELEEKYFNPILDKYSVENKCDSAITYKNETHTLSEWAKITGINYPTLQKRYKLNSNDLDYVFKK